MKRRSNRELLKVFNNNKALFKIGLCQWVNALCKNNHINNREYCHNFIRSNKELLEVFLNNRNSFSEGLCHWSKNLRYYKIINLEEYYYIKDLMSKNKPLLAILLGSSYYWIKGDIEPRINWLKKNLK